MSINNSNNYYNQATNQHSWQQQQAYAQGQPYSSEASGGADPADLLSQAMQGATVMPVPGGGGPGFAIERGGGFNLLDFVFNNASARRHMAVIDQTTDIFEETAHGMELSAALILGCASTCMANEAAMEQIIMRYSGSKMALASAPLYIQLARQMQLQNLPEMTQTGVNLIKQKLERR